jgi:hypothetical protein
VALALSDAVDDPDDDGVALALSDAVDDPVSDDVALTVTDAVTDAERDSDGVRDEVGDIATATGIPRSTRSPSAAAAGSVAPPSSQLAGTFMLARALTPDDTKLEGTSWVKFASITHGADGAAPLLPPAAVKIDDATA